MDSPPALPASFVSAVQMILVAYAAWVVFKCGKIVVIGALHTLVAILAVYAVVVYVPRDHAHIHQVTEQLVVKALDLCFDSHWPWSTALKFFVPRASP